jgi:hypothetical protein
VSAVQHLVQNRFSLFLALWQLDVAYAQHVTNSKAKPGGTTSSHTISYGISSSLLPMNDAGFWAQLNRAQELIRPVPFVFGENKAGLKNAP